MESELLTLVKQMNKRMESLERHVLSLDQKVQNIGKRFDEQERSFKQTIKQEIEESEQRTNAKFDRHEQLLQQLIKMTAKNSEDIVALSLAMKERTDKLELASYRQKTDLLFQETQSNKRDIAQLKN